MSIPKPTRGITATLKKVIQSPLFPGWSRGFPYFATKLGAKEGSLLRKLQKAKWQGELLKRRHLNWQRTSIFASWPGTVLCFTTLSFYIHYCHIVLGSCWGLVSPARNGCFRKCALNRFPHRKPPAIIGERQERPSLVFATDSRAAQ